MRDTSSIPQEGARSTALIRRLVRDFIWRHWRRIAIALLCMAVASGSIATRAWLMEPVLDRVFIARDSSLLLLLAVGALVLALVKGLADYAEAVLMTRVGQRVIADVQTALFGRLIRSDLAYFNAHPSGVLISRFISDVWLLRSAAGNVLTGIGKDALTIVFLVGVMFYQDWVLALVAFVAFPLAIRPIVAIGRRMRRVSVNTQVEMGQVTTLLSQTFQGARHVKAYGMEAYEENRAANLFERLYRLVDRATRARARAGPMMEALGGVAIAMVIFYGGHQVIAGTRTPGAFFSFITALLLAYQPVKSLASLNVSLQEGLAAAQRVFEVLDTEPTIRDRPGARPLRVDGGEVRFEDVRFGYHPGTVALEKVSLIVPAGSTVALVGPSGAGKSTLLNLIPRFAWISAAVHGDEVNGVEIIGGVLERITPQDVAGCLIVAPIVNVFGFNAQSRYLPDRRDLNRSFPGSERGSLAARIAFLFMQEVVRKCQYGIDLHTGSNHRTNLPQIRANLHDDQTRQMAEAFSAPVIMHAGAIDGSLRKAATDAGARTIVFEAGEPLRFDDAAIQLGRDGVLRVLAALGMLKSAPKKKGPHSALVAKTTWVRALNSGILRLDTRLGATVATRQQLGLVADAFGEDAAPILAPEDGLVIGHTNNPLVQQGEAVLHLATMAPEGAGAALPEIEVDSR